ncbi:MAG: integrase, partial [Desulfobacteraceae bacterium]|nr:integrase [Desulfobacteraceae bacterium]
MGEKWEMRVMLKGIHKIKRTNAKGQIVIYYYAWRGGPRIQSKPNTEAFLIEFAGYKRLLKTDNIETLEDLIDSYAASPEYTMLAETTRKSHQYAFKHIRRDFPNLPIKLLCTKGTKTRLRNWRNKWVDKPRTADSLLNSFKRILTHAVDNEFIDRNPATGIKNIWNGSRKNNIWTPTQIEILRQKAPEPIIRAMLLAFYTG